MYLVDVHARAIHSNFAHPSEMSRIFHPISAYWNGPRRKPHCFVVLLVEDDAFVFELFSPQQCSSRGLCGRRSLLNGAKKLLYVTDSLNNPQP